MADLLPTYTFEGDEVFAIHEGKVIASGKDMAQVESDATKYLDSLKTTREQVAKEQAKKTATHIITPNGVKGQILGRTPTVWGERITARFEQGEIQEFEIHGESNVQWVKERTASAKNPADSLKQRLASDYSHDRESLVKRHNELLDIAKTAHRLISNGAPLAVEVQLDEIRTAAEYERTQIKEAVDHLDAVDAEAIRPPEPQHVVVEQADLGRGAQDNWLDVTAQEMIAESEATDFDQVLKEGPALFVAELDNGALADTGVTREMAYSHITSKTAGFQGEEVDDFRDKFVARVEVARRAELAERKESNKKEAAAEQDTLTDAPVESLFM